MKQKGELVNEISSLKVELQQVKDDRDRHLVEVKTLQTEATKYNDFKDAITELEVSYLCIISCKEISVKLIFLNMMYFFFVPDYMLVPEYPDTTVAGSTSIL